MCHAIGAPPSLCRGHQAYVDGFQAEARQVRLIALPSLQEPVPPARGQRQGQAPAQGRGSRSAIAPQPPADCAVPASINQAAAERCGIMDRQALTELAFRHAGALAGYFSALASTASQFDPTPAAAPLAERRAEAMALGDDLMRVAGIDAGGLEPYRPVEARVGLRPAFAAEMASHGWQMRRQWQIHEVALARLAMLPGGDADRDLRRLRAATAGLRTGFEALVRSDDEALPMIAGARAALAR